MVQGEVLTGPERRRRWSAEEKARVVAELGRPGVQGAEVARRHGVSRSLLYAWRKQLSGVERVVPESMAFAPVLLAGPSGGSSAAASTPMSEDVAIEIETRTARVRLPADTKPSTVLAILKILRGRA
jgi:transposase-like protein